MLSVAFGAEPGALMCVLDKLLLEAGWRFWAHPTSQNIAPFCTEKQVTVNGSSGIHVWVRPDAPDRVRGRNRARKRNSKVRGFEDVIPHVPTNSMTDAATIHLMIGSKL